MGNFFDLDSLPFDPGKFPYGAKAGDNKAGFVNCPTCGKAPCEVLTEAPVEKLKVWPFRDHLSAFEYRISGMCQECQDSVFDGGEE